MDKERMAELEKIESHGAENGWVAPMAEEDKAFFAYFRSVLKRYNISPSKATRLEYDFVTRVAESEFYLQKVNAGYSSLSGIAQKAFNFACVKSDIRLRIAFEPRWRNSGEALFLPHKQPQTAPGYMGNMW